MGNGSGSRDVSPPPESGGPTADGHAPSFRMDRHIFGGRRDAGVVGAVARSAQHVGPGLQNGTGIIFGGGAGRPDGATCGEFRPRNGSPFDPVVGQRIW